MNEKIKIDMQKLTNTERKRLIELAAKTSVDLDKVSCVWKPEKKEHYYYVDSCNCVDIDNWDGADVDEDRLNIGNVFETEQEAYIVAVRQKVKTELQRYALEHNDPEKESWNKANCHYMIVFDHMTNDLSITQGYYLEEESATHFTSREIAREAITTIGRERIAKYLFNVEV